MKPKPDTINKLDRMLSSGSPSTTKVQKHWRIPLYISVLLLICSTFNSILFHTLIELFAIGIAIMSFVVSWNTYPFSRNQFLLYLGCGYFWIGLVDLFHTLSFEGVQTFTSLEASATIEFWIVGRLLEALILLAAPFTLLNKFHPKTIFLFIGTISSLAIAAIFLKQFPDLYIEGEGLTDTKIISEYIIIGILILAAIHIRFKRY